MNLFSLGPCRLAAHHLVGSIESQRSSIYKLSSPMGLTSMTLASMTMCSSTRSAAPARVHWKSPCKPDSFHRSLPQFITRLSAFCKSSTLLDRLECFCKHHAEVIVGQTSTSEFPLEFTMLHEQYCALVEAALEEFLAKQPRLNGKWMTADAFYAECKACLDRSKQESRWHRDAMVVQVFSASNEFQEWVSLMRSVAENEACSECGDHVDDVDDVDDSGTLNLPQSPVALS